MAEPLEYVHDEYKEKCNTFYHCWQAAQEYYIQRHVAWNSSHRSNRHNTNLAQLPTNSYHHRRSFSTDRVQYCAGAGPVL